MSGLVVGIHRNSVSDGPGIRTSVFLKGCPLNCLWCHNPESVSPRPELSYNSEKCSACGTCINACTPGCHAVAEGRHIFDRSRCTVCGSCVSVCPNNAFEIKGLRMSVEEIVLEAEKDRAYYEASGGGVTVSGGEPMMQFSFTRELVKTFREKHIHTAIETCGFVPEERYREIMPFIDLFLFDWKGAEPKLHRDHTGQDNKLIHDNLRMLHDEGKEIILRCPLVPGVNDTHENLKVIAEIQGVYPNLKGIEIMPYHSYGVSKAEHIGNVNPWKTGEVDASDIAGWKEKIASYGLREGEGLLRFR